MAFPTIPTAAAGRLLSNFQADASGTRTFPSLSGLTAPAGDLIVAIVIAYQSAGTPGAVFSGWGGGFAELTDQMTTAGTTMAVGVATKTSSGSETGTFTVTQASPTGHACMFLLAIPGAHASTPPAFGTIANGTTAAADPGALDPANWAAEDTLWIAICLSGETSLTGSFTAITAAPTNYTDLATVGPSADAIGAVRGGVAFRQLNASSEDVGTFTCDVGAARNSALVLAIRPAAGATNVQLGQPSETETAQPLTVRLGVALGLTSETETAQTVTPAAGGGDQPPTRVAYAESTWHDTTSPKTAGSVSWLAGDEVYVLAMSANNNTPLNTPTVTGLTFNAVGTNPTGGSNQCLGYAWKAVAASDGSGSVQITKNAGVDNFGIAVWVERGTDGTGTKGADASTAKTVNVARIGNRSRMIEIIGDWSAAPVTNHVWTPGSETEDEASSDGSHYTVYVADWPDQGNAGTTAYGITGTSSTGVHTKVAVEVLGTAGAGPTNVPLGQPSETETTLALTARESVALGQDVETETARAVTASRRFALGFPSETETTLTLAPAKRVALGQAAETETAQPIGTGGPRQVALAQPVETETAQPATAAKRVALGQALDTETARAVSVTERIGVALSVETETARAATLARRYPLGLPVETETARPVVAPKRVALGIAAETETSQPVSTSNVRIAVLGQVAETESARGFTLLERVALAQPAETESSTALRAARLVALSRPSETETASGFAFHRGIPLGQLVETETSRAVSVLERSALAQTLETEAALAVVPAYPSGWRDVTVGFELEPDRVRLTLDADRLVFELEPSRARLTFEEDA